MIVLITGGLGSGKTCMLTRYGKIAFSEGKNMYSNYHLVNMPYKKLDIVDMFFNEPDLKDVMILGDEIYTFMDCRMSGAKRNRLQSYFIAQTRKRNVDLYGTAQFSQFTDLRLTAFLDVWIKMENIWIMKDGKKTKHPYFFLATFHDYRDENDIKIFTRRFDGRTHFNDYDTNERIYPHDDYIQTAKELSKHKKN